MASTVPTEIDHQKDKIFSVLRRFTWWETITPATMTQLTTGDSATLGREFTSFLANGGRVFLGRPTKVAVYNPTMHELSEFINLEGWCIVEEETDLRAASMETLNIGKVHLRSTLKYGEQSITGAERIARIKEAGYVRLGAGMFLVFWNNQDIIPENLKDSAENTDTGICFDGTVLISPYGEKFVFCLYRLDDEWRWTLDFLNRDCGGAASAVIHASK
jgi:hypothetical protein